MSFSQTTTTSNTFTLTHAKYIASKVATDLLRFQRLYGSPSDKWINDYEGELTLMLKHDAVSAVTYGFKRNGKWTEAAVRYQALGGGMLTADDDPGKIRPGLDIAGASFTSFMEYSPNWWALTDDERKAVKKESPVDRSTGDTPPLEVGYWEGDLTYGAAGRGLGRSSVRR